uniref:Reverse transcriptase domain-containing protein n=1 Tax=Xenopus tropicalis TaxID=8364 RepID=A0A803JSY9_XENTR
MTSISLCSWNVRGLNSKYKRAQLFTYVKKCSPTILLLQETHLVGSKILALKKPWVAHHFHSPFSSHARGVAILVRKNVMYETLHVCLDVQGRYVILQCKINSTPITIVNLYNPPPGSPDVLTTTISRIANLPPAPLYIMGDFNALLHPNLDKLNSVNHTPTALANRAINVNLTEIWRWKYPNTIQYSCHSATHKTLSRIDFAFASPDALALVEDITYLPRAFSDHSPLMLQLKIGQIPSSKMWRLSPLWLANDMVKERNAGEYKEFWENNNGTASISVCWETSKAVARGNLINAITAARNTTKQICKEAENQFNIAEQAHVTNPNAENHANLTKAQQQLELTYTTLTNKKLLYTAQRIFDQGEKNGKTLAYLAATTNSVTVIPRAVSEAGNVVTKPQDIMQVFYEYYATLYQSKTTQSAQTIADYLAKLPIPKFDRQQANYLNNPITKQEIIDAIQALPSNKTPGPDGLPPEWYRSIIDDVAPQLLTMYEEAFNTQQLPPSVYSALIILILKSGKNPEQCSSYRPISLMNTDGKILAKILANRLIKIITAIIHPDQSGFMPNKSTTCNLRRLYTNLQIAHENSGSRIIVSLDSAKAFDTVEWPYLWETLKAFGCGPNFITWIKILYKAPQAQIRVNNLISPPFSLHRGTRQGCPLSPLLFAMAIEPLAIAIRHSTNISGFRLRNIEERIALYADDILLFLADPHHSLQEILKIVQEFGSYSGLRVNWDKSQIMPVDTIPPVDRPTTNQLTWADEIKYLGIIISPLCSLFQEQNLEPLYTNFISATVTWQKLPLTLWGRINLFKMIFLPKFLYFLRNAPTTIPKKFFSKINGTISSFLWAGKQPRFSWKSLTAPLGKGGLQLPDMYLYHIAAQLSHIHPWFLPDAEDPNMALIATILGSLEAMTHCPLRRLCDSNPLPPVLLATYQSWQTARKLTKSTPYLLAPHTPLWGNSHFMHFRNLEDFIYWPKMAIKTLGQILQNDTLMSLPQLLEQLPNLKIEQFRYMQLRHAFKAQFGSYQIKYQNYPIDSILRNSNPKKLVSNLYNILQDTIKSPFERALVKWRQSAPTITDEQWEEATDSGYIPHILAIEFCIFGVMDEVIPLNKTRILCRSLLFYAKKNIILNWLKPTTPTISQWLNLVNKMLPMIKLTYEARGIPDKFDRVWGTWVDIYPTV